MVARAGDKDLTASANPLKLMDVDKCFTDSGVRLEPWLLFQLYKMGVGVFVCVHVEARVQCHVSSSVASYLTFFVFLILCCSFAVCF